MPVVAAVVAGHLASVRCSASAEPSPQAKHAQWFERAQEMAPAAEFDAAASCPPVPAPPPAMPQFVSPATIAARWGCSPQHVRNLIARGELRGCHFGAVVRVKLSDLEAFEAQAVKSVEPPMDQKTAEAIAAARRAVEIARASALPRGRGPLTEIEIQARKGLKLISHPEVAAALVQWPVCYPRWLTHEQRDCIRWACFYHHIKPSDFSVARRQNYGARVQQTPIEPAFSEALEKLKVLVEAGQKTYRS